MVQPAGAAGTGDAVIISASVAAFDGYEQAAAPGQVAAVRPDQVTLGRRSLRSSRRAVLYVQAAGDTGPPTDMARWFTERGFHFYLAMLGRSRWFPQPGAVRDGLDAACAHLQHQEGMQQVIVAAQGRGARAAALWSARTEAASALVLIQPDLPARSGFRLSIACPVLVVTGPGRAAGWRLGGHVTALQLPAFGGNDGALAPVPLAGPPEFSGQRAFSGQPAFFDELGRWLGAYMYGQLRDQLL